MSTVVQRALLFKFQNSILKLSEECVQGNSVDIGLVGRYVVQLCSDFKKLQYVEGPSSATITLRTGDLIKVQDAVLELANVMIGRVDVRKMEDCIDQLCKSYANLKP